MCSQQVVKMSKGVCGVPRMVRVAVLLAAGILGFATLRPAAAQFNSPSMPAGTGLGSVFELSSAIPGTSEYHFEKRSRQLSAMLADLEQISAARVLLTEDTGKSDSLNAIVQLQMATDARITTDLCRTIVTLIQHVEPAVPTDSILITDRQGGVYFEKGHPVAPTEPPAEDGLAPAGQSACLRLALIGLGVLFGLGAFIAWWICQQRRRFVANPPPESTTPWNLLCKEERRHIVRFLSEQRPEFRGAVFEQLDEINRTRLSKVFRNAGSAGYPPPQRSMHPEVAQVVTNDVRQMMSKDQRPALEENPSWRE